MGSPFAAAAAFAITIAVTSCTASRTTVRSPTVSPTGVTSSPTRPAESSVLSPSGASTSNLVASSPAGTRGVYQAKAAVLASRIPGCTHLVREDNTPDEGGAECSLLGASLDISAYKDAAHEDSDRAFFIATPGYVVVGPGWLALTSPAASPSVQKRQAQIVKNALGGVIEGFA